MGVCWLHGGVLVVVLGSCVTGILAQTGFGGILWHLLGGWFVSVVNMSGVLWDANGMWLFWYFSVSATAFSTSC
jgi:hypothetical protein